MGLDQSAWLDRARSAASVLRGKRIVLIGDSIMGQVMGALELELLRHGNDSVAAVFDSNEYARLFPKRTALAIAKACRLPVRSVRLARGARLSLYSVHLRPSAGTDGMSAQWSTVDRALASADVVVANFGLHWRRTDRQLYIRHVGHLAEKLAAFAGERPAARLAVLLETLPQHFPSRGHTGDFDDLTATGPCQPVARAAGPGWRNIAARSIAASHGVHLLRAHQAMAPLHAKHVNDECTHWCYDRIIFAPILDGLFRLAIKSTRTALHTAGAGV